ncbi:molybdopterin-binding protein [Chelatococcus asaccharovorans]|uniref:molybdopterin-binding protein n=1 Tax=Chelatococcus asaccharovorans TaxID=28210 RepID=UPI00224C6892|nr:molybdopterin-binding protein [Chelatococcus asaccharovorans]CAH1665882.1 Molybdopterin molybdenumtransferase [Chelatococcus asaccharovorans]CAH1681736.1 Molybdopterin molybdenumtransferase [Chelatococcus asaccharovorans]
MKFGPVGLDEAEGAVVAHSVRLPQRLIKKGSRLAAADIADLKAAGVTALTVARLEPDDVPEDRAAAALAEAVAGPGVRVEAPFTGRANLYAATSGVLVVDAEGIDAVNAVDETVTVATLQAYRPVAAGDMVGTVKIIPYAVAGAVLARTMDLAAGASPLVQVAPYRLQRVAVISTRLPSLKESTIDKTLKVLRQRLAPAGATIVADLRVDHETAALAAAIEAADAAKADLLVIFGASAVADRRDVVPAALEAVGGEIRHLGMPVDPGNLLLLGERAGRPVLGAPGCARSPKENGFDWILHRLLARLAVTRADITRLGVGGLLMEIRSRPQPREGGEPELDANGHDDLGDDA